VTIEYFSGLTRPSAPTLDSPQPCFRRWKAFGIHLKIIFPCSIRNREPVRRPGANIALLGIASRKHSHPLTGNDQRLAVPVHDYLNHMSSMFKPPAKRRLLLKMFLM
jgi:hypothetical protein